MITRRVLLQTGTIACSGILLSPWASRFSCNRSQKAKSPNLFDVKTSSNQDRRTINARARVLLKQLSLGLDYYGQPKSFAPESSASYLLKSLTEMISGGIALENSLEAFESDKSSLDHQLSTLNAARTQALAQLDRIQQDFIDIPKQQNTILTQIATLSSDLVEARSNVLQAASKLSDTLGGCPFQNVFQAASMIVMIASGAPPILESLVGAASAAASGTGDLGKKEDGDDDSDGKSLFGKAFDTRIRGFKTIGNDVPQLTKLYNDAKASASSSNDPIDATKVLMQSDDFVALRATVETQVDKLPESSEKDAYVDAANRYINISQSRNLLLIAYDGLSYQLAATCVSEQDTNAALVQVQGSIAAISSDADQAKQSIAFTKQLKKELVRDVQLRLIRYAQAVSFSTLTSYAPPDRIDDFGVMDAQSQILQGRYRDGLPNLGHNPPGQVDTKGDPLQIALTPKQIQTLLSSGTMSFQISSRDPYFTKHHGFGAAFGVDSMTIMFYERGPFGSKQIPSFPLTLQHSGYHKFFNQEGMVYEFVSPIRPLDSGDGSVISGFTNSINPARPDESDYVAVSPYTTWSIFVEDAPKKLASLTHLTIVFKAHGYPLSQSGIKVLRSANQLA